MANIIKNNAPDAIRADLIPALSYHPSPASPEHQRKYKEALKLGKELISSGKVTAFVVAGGQGTRLGFDGPKGNFPVSPVRNKTLFQIFYRFHRCSLEKIPSRLPLVCYDQSPESRRDYRDFSLE